MTSELLEKEKPETSIDDFFEQLTNEHYRRISPKKYKPTPEHQAFQELLDMYELNIPTEGELVHSKYMGVVNNQHVFSVNGFKDDVRVESRPDEDKYLKNTNVGDMIDVLVILVDEDNYSIVGSISQIYENRAHLQLKALEEGLSVDALIKSINPAGYDIEILHDGVTLSAFMPNTLAGINKLHNPESIVGQTLPVMIESYSREEGTYIVSRRKYLKSLIPDAIKELEHGVIYTGHVTGTTPFGIFVEFEECLTGMIHKANVDPAWQDRIGEIKPGFGIEFYIKEVIKDKIILTQVLRETLWDTIRIGQVIKGRVKDNKQFGCLVFLDDETMGLIHSSEIEKSGRRFQADQEVNVKIIAVDRSSRKIFLAVA